MFVWRGQIALILSLFRSRLRSRQKSAPSRSEAVSQCAMPADEEAFLRPAPSSRTAHLLRKHSLMDLQDLRPRPVGPCHPAKESDSGQEGHWNPVRRNPGDGAPSCPHRPEMQQRPVRKAKPEEELRLT